ncbi:MAG: hypothetical protein DWI10_06490 [Planctomycetota bacterium]|nr:MAG: hypothetical protein DWI10_06490 [Planctomycetota bacterium]
MIRAFWCAVLLLVIAGVWFVSQPSTSLRVDEVDEVESSTSSEIATDPATDPAIESSNDPVPSAPLQTEANAPTPPPPDIDLLGEDGVVLAPKIPTKSRTLLTDTRLPNEVITRLDDRTVELDGRFRVTGSGTEADPSRISWELLTSAIAYIDPAQHALTAPPWVRLLNGTTIELSGYYSSAVQVGETKNLLLTLNRWDGCCIGLPPTPFDAIDITLREPLPMRGLHLTRFGTFRGRLIVEPFEAAGYLLSLYRLEDATFETK